MKKAYLLVSLMILSISYAFAQPKFTYKIKADSVLITNDSCTAELILENSTKNVSGFLFNNGNGRTKFLQGLVKKNDSLYMVGNDSLKLYGLGGNYISNQNASAQTANYYISGTGSLKGGLSVGAQFNTTNTNPSYYNSYKAQIWDSLLVEGTGASQVRFTGNNAFNPGFVFNGSTSNTAMYTMSSQNMSTTGAGLTAFNGGRAFFYNSAYIEPFQQALTIKKTWPAVGGTISVIIDNDTSGTYAGGLTGATHKILSNRYAGTEVSYLRGNGSGFFTEDLTVDTLTIGDGAGVPGVAIQNTALGVQVLGVNTTGTQNTGVGFIALRDNTTGNYNVAVGTSAMTFNTTGYYNTAIGTNALQVNTVGVGNSSLGFHSLMANTKGWGNTGIGWSALAANDSGYYNTAVGTEALINNTHGAYNSSLGYTAAAHITTGTYNQGFGAYSLYSNSTGNFNTAYGGNALYYNATGSNNAGLGAGALYECTGSNNTGVGVGAGKNLQSGDYNIFIGHDVLANISLNGSNQLNIGNWIYGDNGKISIGVAAPTAKFQIAAGTASANTAPLKFTSGTNLSTPENGAVEYDGTNYFATSSSTRYTIAKTLTATASLNFGSTSAQSSADLTITVTGAADGDAVSLGVPNGSVNNNSNYTAWVSASNTVTVRFNNYSSGSIDPASGTFRVSVIKY